MIPEGTSVPMETSWLHRRRPNPDAALRLFCFPYAGAGASLFRAWGNAFPPEVDVCSVQLPGRETRLAGPAVRRVGAPRVRDCASPPGRVWPGAGAPVRVWTWRATRGGPSSGAHDGHARPARARVRGEAARAARNTRGGAAARRAEKAAVSYPACGRRALRDVRLRA